MTSPSMRCPPSSQVNGRNIAGPFARSRARAYHARTRLRARRGACSV